MTISRQPVFTNPSSAPVRSVRLLRPVAAMLAGCFALGGSLSAESLPGRLSGSWRITRVLPTGNAPCWSREQAAPLLGSTLTYRNDSLRWRGGAVPLADITIRTVTAAEFNRENGGSAPGGSSLRSQADGPSAEAGPDTARDAVAVSGRSGASFTQLGIHSASVTEVDLQHEDMDITGATTEVPGDSVLLAGPNRIIISACGVFFEATRSAASITHTSAHP